LRVKLLPSRAGSDSQLQALTTFLINDRVAIDGGSIGFALGPEEMRAFRHIVVTHAHSDHTASLPIFVAEVYPELDTPVIIHALSEVVAALREFVFNDQIWPDFEKIPLGNGAGPSLEFRTLERRAIAEICGLKFTPIPVNHVVPTAGLIVRDAGATVVFTSDTYITDEIWEAAREVEGLKAIFVDVSYPNEMEQLAAASKHLTPQSLAADLKKLGRDVEIFAVHIKPSHRDLVVSQLSKLSNPRVHVAEIGRVYEW
jgi:cAMP phosphodiesterase